MLDQNLLFSSASALSGSENLSTAIPIGKTAADGVAIGIFVTVHGTGGSGLTAVEVWEGSAPTACNMLTTTFTGAAGAALFNSGSTGRVVRAVQSNRQYMQLKYKANGAGETFTVTAGVHSGSFPDQTT